MNWFPSLHRLRIITRTIIQIKLLSFRTHLLMRTLVQPQCRRMKRRFSLIQKRNLISLFYWNIPGLLSNQSVLRLFTESPHDVFQISCNQSILHLDALLNKNHCT